MLVKDVEKSGLLPAKGHYSHGLEDVYALESVDPKTIRPLSLHEEGKTYFVPVEETSELEPDSFDFGDRFNGWMEPFTLIEPLSVLGLTPQLKMILANRGVKTLREAQIAIEDGYLGQGHVHELEEKLAAYLKGKQLKRSRVVDFAALLRASLSQVDPMAMHLLFEKYDLEVLAPKGGEYRGALLGLRDHEKEKIIQRTVDQLQGHSGELKRHLHKVSNVFVVPWVERRSGMATHLEIQERWLRIAFQKEYATRIFDLISDVFFDRKTWQYTQLHLGEENVFCSDIGVLNAYQLVHKYVKGYFYNPDLVYPLETLVGMIEREAAIKWESFPEGFIEKVLQSSGRFSVHKGPKYLEVRTLSAYTARNSSLRF